MAAVVPEEEHAPSLIVAEREAPARGEEAEVLEMGVVLGVEVEEVPARSEEAEVLGATIVVQGVVVDEGPPLTNESLRDWVNRWCSGDRRGLPPISTWNTSQVTDMSELFWGQFEFNDDIGAWDTSGVTTMSWMFWNASAFNQPIGGWNVSRRGWRLCCPRARSLRQSRGNRPASRCGANGPRAASTHRRGSLRGSRRCSLRRSQTTSRRTR